MSFENFKNFGSGLSSVGGAVSSLIGGIGSAIQGHKNRKLARELAQKQNDFNWAMAEQEYKRNLDMWNKQNAYNSPAAQMARLESAGLNPNLAYGNLASGVAGTPPSFNAPQAVTPSDAIYTDSFAPISQMGANLNANALANAQEANIRAQTKNVEAQTYRVALQNALLLPAEIADTLNQYAYNPKMREQAFALGAMNVQRMQKDLEMADKALIEMDKKLQGMDYENRLKQLDVAFKELTQDDRIAAAAAEYGMTIEKAKHYSELLKNELLAGQYNVQILYSKMLEESKDNEINIAERESNKVKAEQIRRENKIKGKASDPNTTLGKVVNGFRGAAGLLKWFLSGVADTISPVTGEIGKALGGLFKKN